ncbi:MAG: proline racemase family protein [Ignavibacterium sp.]|nr:MAG: proline racemase family protein [Ignavibacterium sp.]
MKFKNVGQWAPPKNWLKVSTIDTHTAGEPLRIILDGLPKIHGDTILDKRKFMKENLDHLRTALMFEPRGHADMYGCVVTPPVSDNADFGVIFTHNEGYSTMCGHGIIALTKVAVQSGIVTKSKPVTVIRIDTPAGLVTSYAIIKGDEIDRIYFHNVPSYVLTLNQNVEVAGLGSVNFDIAFGGAYYAFVDADKLGISMTENNFRLLIEKGIAIKKTVMENFDIKHPYEKDLNFLYGTIFTGAPLKKENHSRNVCVFADGEVDRSPTGTGVSARLALHYAKKEIGVNDPIVIESIIGSEFTGRVAETTKFADYDAVIPEVEGNAFITGKHEFIIDPKDPLKNGFILR